MGKLSEQTALVTGSSRGIGAATTRLLAGEGAYVVVNYRDKAKRAKAVVRDIETAGGTATAVRADITDSSDVDHIFTALQDLNVLILNASGVLERDVDPDYAYRLNRGAQVDLATKALPLMPRGGRIVYITTAGHENLAGKDSLTRVPCGDESKECNHFIQAKHRKKSDSQHKRCLRETYDEDAPKHGDERSPGLKLHDALRQTRTQ